MDFENSVAIVTGGSKGIGLGISQALAGRGAKVYLIARTRADLEKARAEITSQNGRAEIAEADITDFDQVKGIIDRVYDREGRLDIFVNNAGTYRPASIDTPYADIAQVLELDFLSPFRIAHYLAQKFSAEKRNSLHILTIISQAGFRVFPSGLGYGTAKMSLAAGLFHLEKELEEKNVHNVKLSRLYPGTVATEAVKALVQKGRLQNATSLESVVDTAISLLSGRTMSRDIYVGYVPGEGIKRVYFSSNPDDIAFLRKAGEEILDNTYNPKTP